MTRALVALTCVFALGCETGLPEFRIDAVAPDSGPDNQAWSIRIEGAFTPRLETDFSTAGRSRLDRTYRALLGTTPLRDVQLQDDGALVAQVPAGMVPGTYALELRDPWGRDLTHENAYRVLSSHQLDLRVTGYRHSAIGEQRAFEPFEVTVEAIDSAGAVVTSFNGDVELSDASGQVVPNRLAGFVRGRWTGQLEVRGAFDDDVLTVSDASGRAGSSNPFRILPRVPAGLRFETPPHTTTAGECVAATVSLIDEFGAPAPALSPLSLTFVPAPGLTLFNDSSCTSAVSAPEVAAGEDRLTVYLRGTLAGDAALFAGAAGMHEVAQVHEVLPGPPATLEFASLPQMIEAGSCSSAVMLELRDAFGNPATTTTGTTIALGSTASAGLQLFASPGCTGAVGEATFAAGAGSASFSFRGTVAETFDLSVGGSGLATAIQGATILAGPASAWRFTGAPPNLVAGECSLPVDLEVVDAFGNPSTVAGSTALSFSAPGLSVFDDASCSNPVSGSTLAAGEGSARFHLRGTVAGTYPTSASGGGLTPANQNATLVAAAPDRLAFLTPDRTARAGECSAVLTLEARDAFGNPAAPSSAQTVTFTVAPVSGLELFTDPACTGGAVTSAILGAESSTTSLYFRGSTATTYTLDATVTGWTTTSQGGTVTAADPDRLVVTTSPRTVAAGACSEVVTVETRDPFGNRAPSPGATTLSLTVAPSGAVRFYSDAGCSLEVTSLPLSMGGSSVDFYFGGTTAGTIDVTVTDAGALGSIAQTETVNPAAPDHLVFATSGHTVTAGECSPLVTVESRDAWENLSAPGSPQSISLTGPPGLTFHALADCSDGAVGSVSLGAASTSASFHFRPTVTPGALLTASVSGWSPDATQNQTVSPADADAFAWDPIGSPRNVGVPFPVTVRALDPFGNLATGFGATASLSIAPAGTVSCDNGCSTATETAAFSGGVWSGDVVLGAPAGSARVLTATSGAVSGDSNAFDVTAISTDPAPLADFTFSAAVIIAGQSISFDASPSTDNTTPQTGLEVSWDFTGAGGTPPWTAFTTTKTTSHTYSTAGTYSVVLAVRDADGGVGYASRRVLVLAAPTSSLCVVNTSNVTDDGASSCSGPYGSDGRLSLAEAVRIANAVAGKQTITFSGPFTLVHPGIVGDVTDALDIYAPSGVVLTGMAFDLTAAMLLSNLRFEGNPGDNVVRAGASLTVVDTTFFDTGELRVSGSATLERANVLDCARGTCVHLENAGTLVVRHSLIDANGAKKGIDASGCASGPSLDVQNTVFTGLDPGIDYHCAGTALVRHNTFHANTAGLKLNGGTGHVVRNNVFSSNGTAIDCVGGSSAQRDHHLLFANTSNGCAGTDPNVLNGDPLYVAPGTDFRLLYASPGRDSGVDLGVDVNGPAPGNFFGPAADRGARESF